MPLTQEQLKARFRKIHVWARGGQRAVHKPLLLLYALGRCQSGAAREVSFKVLEKPLRDLLQEFGPSRQSVHPEYPFWRLQNDKLWKLRNAEDAQPRQGHTDAKLSELRKYNVSGGFPKDIHTVLTSTPLLISEIARELLTAHFTDSLHQGIASATGLNLSVSTESTSATGRDPTFRPRVLQAYEYRCAFCGFDVQLELKSVGLEAAHIKWKQAKGPDVESNGLALCVLHHQLFDRGAMTVDADLTMLLSRKVRGYGGFDTHLLAHHGQPMRQPTSPECRPDSNFLKWHEREVFHGPARDRKGPKASGSKTR